MSQNNPSYKDLEIVKNDYPNKNYSIKIQIPEFNCVCPRTGLPDFGCIYIEYSPNKYIIELKSLKLYTVMYRNLGIFHENVTNKFLDDIKRACQPKEIAVRGDFSPRGGIKTEVSCKE